MDWTELAQLLGLASDAAEEAVKDKIAELVACRAHVNAQGKGDGSPTTSAPQAVLDELDLPPDARVEDVTAAIVALKARTPSNPPEGSEPSGGSPDQQATIDALQKDVARLSAQAAQREAAAAAHAAIAACKIPPAQREWAVDYAGRDPEGFAQFVEAQPRLIAAKSEPPKAGAPKHAALTEEDEAVAKLFGTDAGEFAACKARLLAKA